MQYMQYTRVLGWVLQFAVAAWHGGCHPPNAPPASEAYGGAGGPGSFCAFEWGPSQ